MYIYISIQVCDRVRVSFISLCSPEQEGGAVGEGEEKRGGGRKRGGEKEEEEEEEEEEEQEEKEEEEEEEEEEQDERKEEKFFSNERAINSAMGGRGGGGGGGVLCSISTSSLAETMKRRRTSLVLYTLFLWVDLKLKKTHVHHCISLRSLISLFLEGLHKRLDPCLLHPGKLFENVISPTVGDGNLI
jgi:hypothetical protein